MSQRQRKVDYWHDAPMPREQLVLFEETLESRIPDGHPVRVVDEILSRLDWAEWEAESHGRLGQPPIHPSVMCKVLLFAMIRRIRSCRQIEYNLRHSIDFIWLAAGRTIDHSTLSEFRRKHPKQLKNIYRQMVQLAIDLGVAKLAELCIDGSRVLANASRYKTLTAEKTERLLVTLGEQIDKAMAELDANDCMDELFDDGESSERLPSELQDLKARQEKLQAALEYLQDKDKYRKSRGKKSPAQLPITDQDSRVLPNKEGGFAPNYTPMVVTEIENGFIVGADVLIGAVEHTVMTTMLDTVECDFGERPETLMADAAYSAGQNLIAMESREQELLSPIIYEDAADSPARREDLTQPVAEQNLDRLPISAATKCFDMQAFIYVEQTDCFYCPAGKPLLRAETKIIQRLGGPVEQFIYRCSHCDDCTLAVRCRKNSASIRGRTVQRNGFESVRRRHHHRMQHPTAEARYKRRLYFGETPFAVLKSALDLRRFSVRGIVGVQQEWLWGCTAFNLKKLCGMWAGLRVKQVSVAN